ncbi:MAG: hypothetical protein AAF745_15835, partial [Planctomycetota bacterium]
EIIGRQIRKNFGCVTANDIDDGQRGQQHRQIRSNRNKSQASECTSRPAFDDPAANGLATPNPNFQRGVAQVATNIMAQNVSPKI